MTRVLLITGARSLADDPAAEAWARAIITEALAGVDLLIVGDAPGPDAWAWALAGNACVLCHEYITRGVGAGRIAGWEGPARREVPRWIAEGESAHPLRRNAAMVAAARANMLRGHDVSVLALLDGRKPAVVQPGEERPTRGTEHTARLARAVGLTVDARTWPTKGATT